MLAVPSLNFASVILKGATGAGKSYIANALGVAACRKLYKVRYVSLPDLLNEYAVAKALNTQNKVKTAYAKLDLLIIDEWLLRPLPEAEAYDLLEIIDVRYVEPEEIAEFGLEQILMNVNTPEEFENMKNLMI